MTFINFKQAGEMVIDGTDFRNCAHLRFKADLFVPCGGRYAQLHGVVDKYMLMPFLCFRPEAVSVSNVAALVDSEGKPHFKYIVEGANLFVTQQARLHLERRKVVLFKDSSANKGAIIYHKFSYPPVNPISSRRCHQLFA